MASDGAHAWLKRDTLITGGALALASALAWWWLATSDTGMEGMAMDRMAMPGKESMPWTPTYALSVFIMWSIMMVAMMLPSAAPMILLYARVAQGTGTIVFVGA